MPETKPFKVYRKPSKSNESRTVTTITTERSVICSLCGSMKPPTCQLEEYCPDLGQSLLEAMESCFAVNCQPTSLICEECINQLIQSSKFRELVMAEYGNLSNKRSSSAAHSDTSTSGKGPSKKTLKCRFSRTVDDMAVRRSAAQCSSIRHATNLPNGNMPVRDRGEYDEKRLDAIFRPRDAQHAVRPKKDTMVKKVFVNCSTCGQKYPLLRAQSERTDYICSRCKIRENKSTGDYQKNTPCKRCGNRKQVKRQDSGGVERPMLGQCVCNRPRTTPNVETNSPPKKVRNRQKYKLTCPQCPKRFNVGANLVYHLQTDHGILTSPTKGRERPLKLFECQFCHKIFKSEETFQKHTLIHPQAYRKT